MAERPVHVFFQVYILWVQRLLFVFINRVDKTYYTIDASRYPSLIDFGMLTKKKTCNWTYHKPFSALDVNAFVTCWICCTQKRNIQTVVEVPPVYHVQLENLWKCKSSAFNAAWIHQALLHMGMGQQESHFPKRNGYSKSNWFQDRKKWHIN